MKIEKLVVEVTVDTDATQLQNCKTAKLQN
jgi:hypothetical protein